MDYMDAEAMGAMLKVEGDVLANILMCPIILKFCT